MTLFYKNENMVNNARVYFEGAVSKNDGNDWLYIKNCIIDDKGHVK